jgi:hypothetical protein
MHAFMTPSELVSITDDERIVREPLSSALHEPVHHLRAGPRRSFRLVVNDSAGAGQASHYAATLLRPLLELAGIDEVQNDEADVVVLMGACCRALARSNSAYP